MTVIGSVYDHLHTGHNSAINRAALSSGSFDDVWKQAGVSTEDKDISLTTENSDRGIALKPGTSVTRLSDLLASGKVKAINVAELPEEKYQSFMEAEKRRIEANEFYLKNQYTGEPQFPDLTNYPGTKNYADIVVGGQVVAKVDNQGVITIFDDSIAARLKDKLPDDINGKGGPDLAQARAEAAAKLLGGHVLKSSTAISQSQFDALPVPQIIPGEVDYDSMKNDTLYQQIEKMREHYQKTELDRAAYLAKQQIGETAS